SNKNLRRGTGPLLRGICHASISALCRPKSKRDKKDGALSGAVALPDTSLKSVLAVAVRARGRGGRVHHKRCARGTTQRSARSGDGQRECPRRRRRSCGDGEGRRGAGGRRRIRAEGSGGTRAQAADGERYRAGETAGA